MDRRRSFSRLSPSPASVSGGDRGLRAAPAGYGGSGADHDSSSMDSDAAACLEAADATVALLGPAYVELCRAAAVLEQACADYAACLKYLKRRFSPKEPALTAAGTPPAESATSSNSQQPVRSAEQPALKRASTNTTTSSSPSIPTARTLKSTAQAAGNQNIGRTTGRRMSGANTRTASAPFASSFEPSAPTPEATTALDSSGQSVGPPALPERFAALLRKHFDANGEKGGSLTSTSSSSSRSNAAAAAVAAQRQFLDRLSDRKPAATTQTRKGSTRARAGTWASGDAQSQPLQQQMLQAQAPHVQHWAHHVAAVSAARHVQAALRAVDWESIRPGMLREAVFSTAETLHDTMRLWQSVVLKHQSLQAGSSAIRHRNRALRTLLLQSKAQFEGSSLLLSHTSRQRSSAVHRTVSSSQPSSRLYARGQATRVGINDKSDDGEASHEAASTPVHEGPVDAWLPATQWAQAGEGAKDLVLTLSNTHAEACSWVPTYTNQLLSIAALRHNIQLHALSCAVEGTVGTRLIPPTQMDAMTANSIARCRFASGFVLGATTNTSCIVARREQC